MIAKLTGVLDSILTPNPADGAVVDVGGVGYLVFCSRRTLGRLGAAGSAVSLLVETHVREDRIHLYGFIDAAERDWFRLLITVQGVGSRVALAVLGVLDPDRLGMAVAAQDKAALARAEGVGAKLAGRIVAELKDKAGGMALGAAAAAAPAAASGPVAAIGTSAAASAPAPSLAEDAVSALVNLGYGRSDAFGAVAAAIGRLGAEAGLDRVITAALQELVR